MTSLILSKESRGLGHQDQWASRENYSQLNNTDMGPLGFVLSFKDALLATFGASLQIRWIVALNCQVSLCVPQHASKAFL